MRVAFKYKKFTVKKKIDQTKQSCYINIYIYKITEKMLKQQ